MTVANGGTFHMSNHNSSQTSSLVHKLMNEFAVHQLDHIRLVKFCVFVSYFSLFFLGCSVLSQFLKTRAVARPRMNVGRQAFSGILQAAIGQKLPPEFDAFGSPERVLLASFVMSPMAPSLAEAILPQLENEASKAIVAGMLRALTSEDAAVRTILISMSENKVVPFPMTVGAFSSKITELRQLLALLSDECAGKPFASPSLSQDNSMVVEPVKMVARQGTMGVFNVLGNLGILA
ncbi:desiccation-related protein PCC13-62 [Selaginella moellendorffii]|uniref:desiccation-related protein PCC13-62 n=1 Tax=Selaginella moellendorffii TaxID=88036 RepID=UPI000D1D02CE|nr:desiccation-related protein PCC13-62 [Selaginella moellendorffii]|eukprot:XP_024543372.1 desiccation-related protein PCC13-62 [Selaginella moellendorffii]